MHLHEHLFDLPDFPVPPQMRGTDGTSNPCVAAGDVAQARGASRSGVSRLHAASRPGILIHPPTLIATGTESGGRSALRSRGVIDGICYKRNRGQKTLYDWQERWNRLVSKGRARVEHPTAMLKQQLGYRRVRYRGRERNALDFALTACNIKRSLSLRAA